jgi:hypothetical protein
LLKEGVGVVILERKWRSLAVFFGRLSIRFDLFSILCFVWLQLAQRLSRAARCSAVLASAAGGTYAHISFVRVVLSASRFLRDARHNPLRRARASCAVFYAAASLARAKRQQLHGRSQRKT